MSEISESSVDLSLCSECWLPFDTEEHQPKLLKCPSHPMVTVCLQCLKSGKSFDLAQCKTCQGASIGWALDELPLNIYALQLAQWKRNIPPQTTEVPAVEEESINEKMIFDYHRCPFVFSFTMDQTVLGEVHVMSSPYVIQHKFVQALGDFCFRMPRDFQIFGQPEFKPESFYVLECHQHNEFLPFESEVMIYADPLKLESIGDDQLAKLDAAMEATFDEDGRLLKVKCIFFLKSDSSGVMEGGKEIKKSRETIWGTITRGHSLLDWLVTNIPEGARHRRKGFKPNISFTLETRKPVDL